MPKVWPLMDKLGVNDSKVQALKTFTYLLVVFTIISFVICCYLCFKISALLLKSAANVRDSYKSLRRVDSMSKRSVWSVFSRVDKSK